MKIAPWALTPQRFGMAIEKTKRIICLSHGLNSETDVFSAFLLSF